MSEEYELFNVAQYFSDDTWEYVRRRVPLTEAFEAIKHYTNSVGARMGTTIRVLITDSGDQTVYHWEYGRGIVFPILIKETDTIN